MFIKEIEFINTKWFKKWTKIEFFHDEISNMYSFLWFNSKLKFNCIIGNNWAWKTKLLSNIIHFFEKDDRGKLNKLEEKSILFTNIDNQFLLDKNYRFPLKERKIWYLFDDFFIWSDMLQYSINKETLSQLSHTISDVWYSKILNDFFIKLYRILWDDNYKLYFSNFINFDINDFDIEIIFSSVWVTSGWQIKKILIFLEFYKNLYRLIYKKENIAWYNRLYERLFLMYMDNVYTRFVPSLFRYLEGKDNLKRISSELDKYLIEKYWTNYKNNHIEYEKKEIYFYIYDIINILNNYLENIWLDFYDSKNKYKYIKNVNKEWLENNEQFKEIVEYLDNYHHAFNILFENNYFDKIYNIEQKIILKYENIKNDIKKLDVFSIDDGFFLKFRFYDKNWYSRKFEDLSSWEQIIFIRFWNIINWLEQSININHFILLIDEPDLHLHLDWQKKYMKNLVWLLKTILSKDSNKTIHTILATHSPFIVSDFIKDDVIMLKRTSDNSTNKIDNTFNSFWANYFDIIDNWFFFDESKSLIWDYSDEIIQNIAKVFKTKVIIESYKNEIFSDYKEIVNFLSRKINIIDEKTSIDSFSEFEELFNKKYENFDKIINHIWNQFIKDNLIYL